MGDHSSTGPVTGYPGPPPTGYNNHNGLPAGSHAYPFATQPPYQHQNPYYNPYHQDPYAVRATFIRRIFGALIASVIIVGTVVFIVWLILRPRLPEFRVDSFALSNYNLSASTSLLSASWEAELHVVNPNKKITLFYDNIQAAVYYQSELLSDTTLAPFFQDKRNETEIGATFATSGAYVDKWAIDAMNNERGSRDGTVRFNLRMMDRVRFKAGAWQARKRYLRIYCGDLGVRISSNSNGNGLLVGGPKSCRVGF